MALFVRSIFNLWVIPMRRSGTTAIKLNLKQKMFFRCHFQLTIVVRTQCTKYLISCSPDDIPRRSAIVHRNLLVQSSFSFHGPWFIGNGLSPSNSNKWPLIGTKLTKWNASPVKRPPVLTPPLFLSNLRFACVVAWELCAQANSGVFPMARPLFSGFIPFVWVFSLVRVSPRWRSGQFNKIDSNACVAQLFGTTCWAKKMLLTVSSSFTNISVVSTTLRLARLSSIQRNKNMNP